MLRHARVVATVTLLAAVSASVSAAQEAGSEPEPRSVLEGVYTAGQADRGEEVFRTVCSACHVASAFHGPIFQRTWNGRAVYWLYDAIRNTMPQDNPGGLSPGEYLDVIAYVLELNAYPAGEEELPREDAELRRIRFEIEPDSAR